MLNIREKKRGQDFEKSTKSFHLPLITAFSNPKDISISVIDFKNSTQNIKSEHLTIEKIRHSIFTTIEIMVAHKSTRDTAELEAINAE